MMRRVATVTPRFAQRNCCGAKTYVAGLQDTPVSLPGSYMSDAMGFTALGVAVVAVSLAGVWGAQPAYVQKK